MLKILAILFGIICSTGLSGQSRGMETVIRDTVSLNLHKKKIPVLSRAGQKTELAQTYKRIGDYYYKVWYSDSLAHYYKQALYLYQQLGDSFHIAYCSFRIGEEIAFTGQDPQTALSWELPAALYFERQKEFVLAAHVNYIISNIYKTTRQTSIQQQYLEKARKLNEHGKDTLLDIIMLVAHSDELRETGKWNEAHTETLRVVELSKLTGERLFLKIGLLQLGEDYIEMKQFEKAVDVLEQSSAIRAITREADPEIFRLLTICHIRLNHPVEAEKYLSLYKKTADSIELRKQKDHYDELLVQYEAERKQNEIAALQEENSLKQSVTRNQRKFIAGLIIGVAILLGAGWLMFGNVKKRRKLEARLHRQQEEFNRQLQIQKEESMVADFNKQLAEVQLTALSAQMNPHFIFNCMNSIQKYILRNEKTKALEFLQNFSDLMRRVLDNSSKPKVSLDEEIAMLEKYILLEQQRLAGGFDYQISVDPGLQTDFFEVPGMIIQPYVENAIWHGLMNLPAENKGLLRLDFTRQNGSIKCVVEDNGVGREKAAEMEKYKSPQRKSHGMKIAQKRLELLQKENETPPEIYIEDLYDDLNNPAGTRVSLNLQIE